MASAAPDLDHIPVLLNEVRAALSDLDAPIVVDGTFGAGGYSRAALEDGASQLIAIDRDPTAGRYLEALDRDFPGRAKLICGTFSDMDAHVAALDIDRVDAVMLDIGTSSMQLDQAERGFSFRQDGPLDMRMGDGELTAADIVNGWTANDLAALFKLYGEERYARGLANLIVARRDQASFETTADLAGLIADNARSSKNTIHPATRVFQALRIAVNGELEQLVQGLVAAERILRPGGRLIVVTFHSLEDRIVKRFFAKRSASGGGSRHAPIVDSAAPTFRQIMRKAILPSDEEVNDNPRARSAKLRWAERTDAPSQSLSEGRDFGLPPFRYPDTALRKSR